MATNPASLPPGRLDADVLLRSSMVLARKGWISHLQPNGSRQRGFESAPRSRKRRAFQRSASGKRRYLPCACVESRVISRWSIRLMFTSFSTLAAIGGHTHLNRQSSLSDRSGNDFTPDGRRGGMSRPTRSAEKRCACGSVEALRLCQKAYALACGFHEKVCSCQAVRCPGPLGAPWSFCGAGVRWLRGSP
jgi:hypothetical protein